MIFLPENVIIFPENVIFLLYKMILYAPVF